LDEGGLACEDSDVSADSARNFVVSRAQMTEKRRSQSPLRRSLSWEMNLGITDTSSAQEALVFCRRHVQ